MRNTLISSPELRGIIEEMKPMFPLAKFNGKKSSGKYSYTEDERVDIFGFIINEIRRHSPNCTIALCKESESVWNKLGLSLSECSCVCQLDYAVMPQG